MNNQLLTLFRSFLRRQGLVLSLSLLSAVILCCSYRPALALSESHHLVDRIVAVVNHQVITQRQLEQQITRLVQHIKSINVAMPSEQMIREKALEQLINRFLQLQIAKRAHIEVKEQSIDGALKHIMDQEHITQAELEEQLAKDGMTLSAYRQEMRLELTISKLQQVMISERVNVTETKIEDTWKAYKQQIEQDTVYHFKDIFIELPDGASIKAVQAKRAQAQALLKLQRQDKLPAVTDSGEFVIKDWGMQHLSSLPTAFAKVIIHMREGQSSQPIQTGDGFHVLHLLIKKAPSQQMTRLQVANNLRQKEFFEAVKDWLIKQKGHAYIKIFD